MIYTLELFPSLEYSGYAESVTLGADNRVSGITLGAGGGMITAQVLAQLEVPATAVGFAAGYSGGEIEEVLRRHMVNTDFIYLENGLSPMNLLVNRGEETTRFVTAPPDVSFDEITSLLDKLSRLKDGDTLLISGSVPESVPSDIYEHIPDLFEGRNVRIALDIPAENAAKCLRFSPFLLVTSPEHIAKAFGEPPANEEEIFYCISQFREMGAQNVLVYLDNGALLLDKEGVQHKCVDSGALSSACGAAKSAMIAGYLAGADDSDVDGDYALMLAAAASRAAREANGIPTKPKILDIMKKLLKNFAVQ